MNWAQRIIRSLKDTQVSLVAYVPDNNISQIVDRMKDDPFFQLVPASREEEAIGIAAGAYAVGRNSAVFMQSSGFGNCLNALGSLCIAHRLPIPMFINLRGQLGEFNTAQVPIGRAVRPMLDVLGLAHYTLTDERDMETVITGAVRFCYTSRQPVAVCLTPQLHGGKGGKVV